MGAHTVFTVPEHAQVSKGGLKTAGVCCSSLSAQGYKVVQKDGNSNCAFIAVGCSHGCLCSAALCCPQFPCEPQIVGCPAIGQLPATNQSASWSYARPGAQIVIPGSAMPYTSTNNPRQDWSVLEKTSAAQLCNPQLLGAGAVTGHVCSYMCFTSQFVNDPSNLCWFDPYSVPAPGASLCSLACLRPNSLL